jgi:hypothetical protein
MRIFQKFLHTTIATLKIRSSYSNQQQKIIKTGKCMVFFQYILGMIFTFLFDILRTNKKDFMLRQNLCEEK